MGLRFELCLTVLIISLLVVQAQEVLKDVEIGKLVKRDLEFDNKILEKRDRPETEPKEEEVKELYIKSTESLQNDAKAVGELEAFKLERSRVEVNLYVMYLHRSHWYNKYLGVCPFLQNNDCRGTMYKLPCFYNYVNGRGEWCCPFWWSYYYFVKYNSIVNCNCGKCYRRYENRCYWGHCYRHYAWSTVYAVCYRGWWWGVCRRISMYLPVDCYCGLQGYEDCRVLPEKDPSTAME